MAVFRLALAALAIAGVAHSAPLQPRATTCYSGVYMIVACGTNESGEGRSATVADAVAAQIPNSASVAVDYPASVVNPPYADSVEDGITDAISKIEAYVSACGSASRIALIGFSQGGQVLTDVLAGGTDKASPINSTIAQSITAVTVFGDPTFTADQTFDQGTATTNGIFSRQSGDPSLALLNTYAPILQSYCNSGDPYCAKGLDELVHHDEVSDHLAAATAFIVSKNS